MAHAAAASEQGESEALLDLGLDELLELDVITPSKTLRPLKGAPATVVVLSEREIRLLGASSIPDLLRNVPGLDVMTAWSTGTQIGGRGLNTFMNAKMLVLLDGYRMNVDLTGEVRWHELPVFIEDVERIEISLSPLSALYGANALGGIVHIITKRADKRAPFRFEARQGNKGFQSYRLSHGQAVGKLGYAVGIGWDEGEGWGQRNAAEVGEPVLSHASLKTHEAAKLKDRWNLMRFTSRAHYTPYSNSEVGFTGGATWGDVSIPDLRSSAGKLRENLRRTESAHGNLQYQRSRPGVSDLTLSLQSGFRQERPSGTQPVERFTTRRHTAESRYSRNVFDDYRVTAGVFAESAYATSESFGSPDQRADYLYGGFTQGEANILSWLTAVGGVRFDKHSDMAGVYSPRGSVVVALAPDHDLRFGAGRAFRKASFLETYTTTFDSTVDPSRTGIILGQLEQPGGKRTPERISYHGVDYRGVFADTLIVRVGGFLHQVRALITLEKQQPADPFQFAVLYSNKNDVDIAGGELELTWAPSRALHLFANTSYQRLDFKTPVTTETLSVPEVKGNLGLLYSGEGGFRGSVVGQYVGEKVAQFGHAESETGPYHFMRIPPHLTVNAKVAYEVFVGQRRLELGLTVMNIFDKRHLEYPIFDGASKYFGYADPADNWTKSQKRHYENRNALNDRRVWAHAIWRF